MKPKNNVPVIVKPWVVKIPKRFKSQLEQRFNVSNAVKSRKSSIEYCETYKIHVPCPLCTEFISSLLANCDGCPFDGSESNNTRCLAASWITSVIKDYPLMFMNTLMVIWDVNSNNVVVKQMEILRRKAEKYIEWV